MIENYKGWRIEVGDTFTHITKSWGAFMCLLAVSMPMQTAREIVDFHEAGVEVGISQGREDLKRDLQTLITPKSNPSRSRLA
jgi:hypothetical protein